MYTALAQVYDLFGEHDEAARADYYARFLPKGEGADVGCGTGALTTELYRRGYRVYGIDSSRDMLQRATERAAREGLPVRFIEGDARRIPYAHPLDFVLAANDVFNYVHRCAPAFEGIRAALKEGGIFAFDISSAYKLKNVLAGNTFSDTKEEVTYVWQNFRKGDKLNIEFTVFSPAGATYIKTCERQTQYAHAQAQIVADLQSAGFRTVKTYAFGTLRKPKENSMRLLFVAQK